MSYSQFDEEKIISEFFEGKEIKFFVDIGAHDGETFSNTKALKDKGVAGLMFDAVDRGNEVIVEKFTAENINVILDRYEVPEEISVLSIDVDGNDYWLWKALKRKPEMVLVEYNPQAKSGYIQPYNEDFMFDRDKGMTFDGTSREALELLAEEKGYRLLDHTPSNLLFVKK